MWNLIAFSLLQSLQIVQIYDADTLLLKTAEGFEVSARLSGIDCPERSSKNYPRRPKAKAPKKQTPGQPLAEEATKRLEELLKLPFDLKINGRDLFKRSLVEIVLKDKRVVNQILLEEGLCEFFRKSSGKSINRQAYQEAQKRAQTAKKGIWGLSHYEPPAIYRRRYSR